MFAWQHNENIIDIFIRAEKSSFFAELKMVLLTKSLVLLLQFLS